MNEPEYIDICFDEPNGVPQAHPCSQRGIDIGSTLGRTKDFPGRCVHSSLTNLLMHLLLQLADVGIIYWFK